jgi:hypothetical protein
MTLPRVREIARGARNRAHELAVYLLLLLRRRPRTTRVLLLAQGRTGSTVLEDLLGSTGHFVTRGEVLGYKASSIFFPAAFVKGLTRIRRNQNFFCHVKPYHLASAREGAAARRAAIATFLEAMVRDGFRIIHLKRNDKVRHYLSGQIALARGAYHKKDAAAETLKIVVDRQQFEQGLERRRQWDRDVEAALQRVDHITLEYERDLEDSAAHQGTVDRVLDFLRLERRPATTSLRKINQRPLSDVVENYDELVQWMSELGMAEQLPPSANEIDRKNRPKKRDKSDRAR